MFEIDISFYFHIFLTSTSIELRNNQYTSQINHNSIAYAGIVHINFERKPIITSLSSGAEADFPVSTAQYPVAQGTVPLRRVSRKGRWDKISQLLQT